MSICANPPLRRRSHPCLKQAPVLRLPISQPTLTQNAPMRMLCHSDLPATESTAQSQPPEDSAHVQSRQNTTSGAVFLHFVKRARGLRCGDVMVVPNHTEQACALVPACLDMSKNRTACLSAKNLQVPAYSKFQLGLQVEKTSATQCSWKLCCTSQIAARF